MGKRTGLVVGAIALAWSLVPVAVAPAQAEQPAPPVIAACTKLAVIGDSLTVGAAPYLSKALGALGIHDFAIDAQQGRHIRARASRSGVRALRALRVKGFEPDCAVVALGTNDVMISADPNRYTAWIGEMLDEMGEIPVLWVNVAFQKQVARARAFNEVLVAMQATRPRLAVADWFTAAEPHPEWLGPDRLHLRRAGYQYRGTWLASLILDELYGVAPVDDAPDCTITVRLRLGTMHDDVVCLETRLEQFGFEVAGGPDRRFDVTTYRAVARFQSRHWMAPNGIVGPGTVVALGLEG